MKPGRSPPGSKHEGAGHDLAIAITIIINTILAAIFLLIWAS